MDKLSLYKIPYGVFLVTTGVGEELGGCIVNEVIQITDFPTYFIVSIDKKSHTASLLVESEKCIIGIISEHCSLDVINHFLTHRGDIGNKFDAHYSHLFTYKMIDDMPLLDKNMVFDLICDVREVVDVDTHYLFVLKLRDVITISKNDRVMTDEMYKRKKENNEIAKEREKENNNEPEHLRTDFVCTFCQYVYDGDTKFEELPDDYKCPRCGHSKDSFIEKYIGL